MYPREHYREMLADSGWLTVYQSSFQIEHYFPGHDARHKGSHLTIPGSEVPEYINAFHANWLEFCELKKAIPPGGSFTKIGVMGMAICIGGYGQGVCLRAYDGPIDTPERMEEIIASYRSAIVRAAEVQKLLWR